MVNPLDGLNDDFIAFGKAGLDKEFTLFKIYTRQLRDPKTGEFGQFHFDCKYELARFETLADPIPFLKYLCRLYLLHAKQKTGVPFEQWVIEFSPVMGRYQIPSHLFFDTARDRNWLL